MNNKGTLRSVRTLLENRAALVRNSNGLNPVGCFFNLICIYAYMRDTCCIYHSIIPAKCSVLQSKATSVTTGGVVHVRIL